MTLVELRPLTMAPEPLSDMAALTEDVMTEGDRLALGSDLADAYQTALRELETLKRDRKRVARKLRSEAELRPWQVELL